LTLQLDEQRDLPAARRAPGGPEVEQHHFAAPVGEVVGLASKVTQGELGRGGRCRDGRGFKKTCRAEAENRGTNADQRHP